MRHLIPGLHASFACVLCKCCASIQDGKDEKEIKWETLRHCGVLFPPEYQRLPSDVKLIYDGESIDLTAEQEEVAGFWAVMKETDYVQKQTFRDNFWEGFQQVSRTPDHSCRVRCIACLTQMCSYKRPGLSVREHASQVWNKQA